MQKVKKPAQLQSPEAMDKIIAAVPKPHAIEEMPLTTYDEYKAYNAAARKENKRLRMCRYPCKPCPIELHPKQRVVFGRIDQPLNAQPVKKSNHLIDYNEVLKPGVAYDLPNVIINHLVEKGTPVWKIRTTPEGAADTYISHYDPRFTLRTVYQE